MDKLSTPMNKGPMTDEEIRAGTVGDLLTHDAPVILAEPDPEWARLFDREAERIGRALGDRALRIEHVGSTSVPDLAAKPVIDILLVVPDSADEPAYVPALTAAGYVLRIREPEAQEHRMFKGPDTNVNLHVFSPGAPEVERMIAFRDRLRADEEDRVLYERTKRELAGRRWRYVQNYADAKTAIVEAILTRAQRS
jgi:GrpB-like predicted nucleotidyltransferase (UPF0157 family)